MALGDVLGKWIAEAGHTLVYGGATGGLMTRVSNATKAAGGTVEGVIPQRIIQAKRMADNCDVLYTVANMCERKQKMKDLAAMRGLGIQADEALDLTQGRANLGHLRFELCPAVVPGAFKQGADLKDRACDLDRKKCHSLPLISDRCRGARSLRQWPVDSCRSRHGYSRRGDFRSLRCGVFWSSCCR